MRNLLLIISILASANAGIYASYEAKALHESKLAFGTVGVISKMNVKLGDQVKRGDVLASLNASVERAQMQAAKAQLALAQSKLNRAKAASKALSQSAMDEALAAKQMASAQLELAKASMGLKQLIAPYDGTVAARMAEIGDGIASPAQPVMVLNDTSAIKLEISFDVAHANEVAVGDLLRFCVDAGASGAAGGATAVAGATSDNGATARAATTTDGATTAANCYEVPIEAIAPSADMRTRKLQARAVFVGGALRAGTYGEGEIIKPHR